MISRLIVVIILIFVFLLIVLPLALYWTGTNIFPTSKTVAPSRSSHAGILQERGILIRSGDGGEHWENAARSEDPAVAFPAAIYSFAIDPNDSNILYLGGAQSGLWKSINQGRTWNRVIDAGGILDTAADVYDIKIAGASRQVIYLAAYEKNHGRILTSQDSAVHFRELYATSAERAGLFSIVADPADEKHLLAATGEGALIETSNGGQTWKIKKIFARPLVRLIADPSDIRRLYVINADGDVFKSVTGGNDWSDLIGTPSGANAAIEYPPNVFQLFAGNEKGMGKIFALDPSNHARLYSGSDKSLLRSEDAGLTWREVSLLFPKELLPVRTMAIDPHKSSTIFAAAAHELQKSTDDGVSWAAISLPAGVEIKKLIIHPKDSRVMFAVVSHY